MFKKITISMDEDQNSSVPFESFILFLEGIDDVMGLSDA